MGQNGQIHIGTSGWSYKHWAGTFYPPEVKPADYLHYYSQHFSVSEINTSFYKLPLKSTLKKWVETVPGGFIFCPKMSRYLSHLKKLNDPQEPLERFFNIFDPFEKHLGPVLVQLPPGLHFHEEKVAPFYDLVKNKYGQYRFAIEVRDDSWFSDESLALMKSSGVSLVFAHSSKFPYHEEITAPDVFVRFHGPKALYSSSYPPTVIGRYAEKFSDWEKQGYKVWGFFNNDVNGHAITNARQLMKYIDEMTGKTTSN